jgi:hypothetical protein
LLTIIAFIAGALLIAALGASLAYGVHEMTGGNYYISAPLFALYFTWMGDMLFGGKR